MDYTKLTYKPCPFCGSDNIKVGSYIDHHSFNLEYYVRCANCGIGITSIDGYKVYASWNRRVNDENKKPPTT